MSCDDVIDYIYEKFNKFHGNINDLIFDIIKIIADFYLFVDNKKLKEEIINRFIDNLHVYIDDNNLDLIIKHILSKNIIFKLDTDILITKWDFINESIKRREYLLLKEDNRYEIKLIKEYEAIKYNQIHL